MSDTEQILDVQKIKRRLNKDYPIGYIPRQEIAKATGGILHPKTMSNRDLGDDGIPGAVKIGIRVCYPITSVVNFLEKNSKILDAA